MFVSELKEIPGADAEPDAALSCPVIDDCPSLGRDPVISAATSVKLALTAEDEIVVPLENELTTVIEPEPLRGKLVSCSLVVRLPAGRKLPD